MTQKPRTIVQRLSAKTQFIKHLISAPIATGAIAPSSDALAKKMASFVPLDNDLPILEIGPGTGAVTRALLNTGIQAKRLTALEYNHEFCQLIEKQFPNIRVIQGDAYALTKTLQQELHEIPKFAAIVSSLPLLNRPKEDRMGLLAQSLEHLESGSPFIQFSYGFKSPVDASHGVSMKKSRWILRNIPPARVFVYQENS